MAFTAPPILIAGGGMAGLTLALALKAGRGAGLDVTVMDPALAPLPPGTKPRGAGRAHAVAASARRMFEALGVWQDVAANAQPITQMIVTDSSTRDVVRPVFLTFDQPEGGAPYAHMVESAALTAALTARAREAGVVLSPLSVTGFEQCDHALTAQLSDGTLRRTASLRALAGWAGITSRVDLSPPCAMHAIMRGRQLSIFSPPGLSRSCRCVHGSEAMPRCRIAPRLSGPSAQGTRPICWPWTARTS
jgi:2-polyprenyl-6-methoxyphenol hydroxylase-like FAD-dependent oxidoreductase